MRLRAAPNARFEAWLASRERMDAVVDPLTIRRSSPSPRRRDAGALSRRKGVDSTLPFESGVTADDASPWTGLPALKFDGKSSLKLPAIDLTGDEPFSMTTWVYLPKIALHPGQTGGSLALVIAGQMTAGDSERTPPIASTGWVFEIDEGVAQAEAG